MGRSSAVWVLVLVVCGCETYPTDPSPVLEAPDTDSSGSPRDAYPPAASLELFTQAKFDFIGPVYSELRHYC